MRLHARYCVIAIINYAITHLLPGLQCGDPHISTMDDLMYTFNGIGEYAMITTLDGSFTLQCRTSQMLSSTGVPLNASAYTAFAAQQTGSSRLEVDLNPSGNGATWRVSNFLNYGSSSSKFIFAIRVQTQNASVQYAEVSRTDINPI